MITRHLLLTAGFLFFIFTNANCCIRALFHACCCNTVSSLTIELLQAIWNQYDDDQIKGLLHQGADPNAFDLESGYTPFSAACEYGNPRIIAIFIQHGVKLDQKIPDITPNDSRHPSDTSRLALSPLINPRKWAGYTPLQIAAACGHADCLEILISAGADIQATVEGKTAFELLKDYCQMHTMPIVLPN
jgi:ankyrin repeat protein